MVETVIHFFRQIHFIAVQTGLQFVPVGVPVQVEAEMTIAPGVQIVFTPLLGRKRETPMLASRKYPFIRLQAANAGLLETSEHLRKRRNLLAFATACIFSLEIVAAEGTVASALTLVFCIQH